MFQRRILGLLLLLSMVFSGCMTGKPESVPLNDEVMTFDLPYDLTFLRTLEALESIYGWELEETEKEQGMIRVRNVNFSRLDDADKRVITFQLERLERNKSSVQIDPESQRTLGGDELLKKIRKYLSREL